MNTPDDCPETEPDNDLVIPQNPALFRHEKIYFALLAKIQDYARGETLIPTDTCRCSYYPLADLVTLACKGDLFQGYNAHTPEDLAVKLTDYLWREVVRTYENSSNGQE